MHLVRCFWRCRDGNIAVLMAVLAPLVLTGVGMAIDLSLAYQARIELAAAMDAATLAAARSGVDYIKATPTISLNEIPTASATGASYFNANIAPVSVLRRAKVDRPIITIASANGLIKATGTVSATVPTSFFRAFGKSSLTITVSSSTSAKAPPYINFTMVLDVSQSMGIGATEADMQMLFSLLKAKYGIGCVFACHGPSPEIPIDSYNFARANGVALRTDAMRNAASTLVKSAQTSSSPKNFTFSIFTMGATLTRIASSTNDYAYLTSAVSSIDQEPSNILALPDSYLIESLTSLPAYVPVSGSGASTSSARQYVLIVTDGMQEYFGPCFLGHCARPMDPSVCTALKNNGATVIVVYTTYLPIYNQPGNPASGDDWRYTGIVQGAVPSLRPALEACASGPTNFFEASDTNAINEAFKTIFTSLQNVMLTN